MLLYSSRVVPSNYGTCPPSLSALGLYLCCKYLSDSRTLASHRYSPRPEFPHTFLPCPITHPNQSYFPRTLPNLHRMHDAYTHLYSRTTCYIYTNMHKCILLTLTRSTLTLLSSVCTARVPHRTTRRRVSVHNYTIVVHNHH